MDCQEVYEKLELLIDGELSDSEKEAVFSHIKNCNHCSCKDRYEAEKCFKDYLQKALYPKEVPQWVIDDIRSYVAEVS
jgi:anti-sigma factor RsiW